MPRSIDYFTEAFAAYLPLFLIFFLNFHLLSVVRRQRKRIFPETTIASADNSTEQSTSACRMRFVLRFLVGLKEAKTFSVVVAVLTICILTPTVVGRTLYEFCSVPCWQFWYVVLNYELYGINSVVNAFIYGMRHVKYRKAYLHILFKLFPCHKATRWKFSCRGIIQLDDVCAWIFRRVLKSAKTFFIVVAMLTIIGSNYGWEVLNTFCTVSCGQI